MRRHTASALRTLVAVGAALLVAGIIVTLAGLDPFSTFRQLVRQAAGSSFALENSLLESVPLTLTALGIALALRGGLFNLGGEGQIYLGALAGVGVALAAPSLTTYLLLPAMLLAAMVAGFAWGAVPGFLRARLGLSEIITTIMLNFIATWIVAYLVRGPIQDPTGIGYPYTRQVTAPARLPVVGATVPVGFLITCGAAVAVWFLLERTRFGLDVKAIGQGEAAARFGGIRIERTIVLLLALAGALAALGGITELSGRQLRLSDSFSPGWGFEAIAVALIGRGTAFGTLVAGVFFGMLTNGIDGLEITAGVPSSLGQLIEGIAVLFLVAANARFALRLVRAPVRRTRVVAEAG
jgi:simple sugar transport system permease protein